MSFSKQVLINYLNVRESWADRDSWSWVPARESTSGARQPELNATDGSPRETLELECQCQIDP